MIKQIIAIILLSILVIMGMTYVQFVLDFLIAAHQWIDNTLKLVFSGGEAGSLIRKLIALLALPLLIAFIPVTIHWFTKRAFFPYFMQLVWVIWLVQATAVVLAYKGIGPA